MSFLLPIKDGISNCYAKSITFKRGWDSASLISFHLRLWSIDILIRRDSPFFVSFAFQNIKKIEIRE